MYTLFLVHNLQLIIFVTENQIVMKVKYIRVSSKDQNTARQLDASVRMFVDKCSGAIPFKDRPAGSELLSMLDQIDYITISSIDRLGRNIIDILTVLDRLEKAKVTVKVENLGIESLINNKPNAAFKMIVSVLANVAEMERENIKERQAQGIAIAKANGKYHNRKSRGAISNKDFLARYKNVVKHLNNKQSLRNTAKLCDVSLSTVQKVKALLV